MFSKSIDTFLIYLGQYWMDSLQFFKLLTSRKNVAFSSCMLEVEHLKSMFSNNLKFEPFF